jgi:hypothetical protein
MIFRLMKEYDCMNESIYITIAIKNFLYHMIYIMNFLMVFLFSLCSASSFLLFYFQ